MLLRTVTQLFPNIRVLTPTEDLVTEVQALFQAVGANGQACCPEPLQDGLSEMLQRFQQWTGWAFTLGVGERLSGHSFISMASGQEETLQAIVERIKGDAVSNSLLMARFFLWLAHQADRTENEVQSGLEALSDQRPLFAEPLEETASFSRETFQPIRLEPLSQVKKRLVNWAELAKNYLIATQELLPLGQDVGVKDLLDSHYEAVFPGRIAQELVTLRLSNHDLVNLEESHEFMQAWQAILQLLMDVMSAQEEVEKKLTNVKGLAKVLEGVVATPEPKTINLTCTMYLGISWQDLLLSACGKQERRAPSFDRRLCGVSFFVF